jgi:hypothetical protein
MPAYVIVALLIIGGFLYVISKVMKAIHSFNESVRAAISSIPGWAWVVVVIALCIALLYAIPTFILCTGLLVVLSLAILGGALVACNEMGLPWQCYVILVGVSIFSILLGWGIFGGSLFSHYGDVLWVEGGTIVGMLLAFVLFWQLDVRGLWR